MPASEHPKPNQASWTQAKPGQVKPTKSSIAYHCKAKQTKQAKQSKAGKAKQSKQAKESKQAKQSKANQSKTSNQTK